MANNRQYIFTLGELLERMSILQLREMLLTDDRDKHATELLKISADIDSILTEKRFTPNALFLRLAILTGELNTLIWIYKDRLNDDYALYLKLSHQINGLRNQIKNIINQEAGEPGPKVTNLSTDGLDFHISI